MILILLFLCINWYTSGWNDVDGNTYCEEYNTTLVLIDDDSENDYFLTLIKKQCSTLLTFHVIRTWTNIHEKDNKSSANDDCVDL